MPHCVIHVPRSFLCRDCLKALVAYEQPWSSEPGALRTAHPRQPPCQDCIEGELARRFQFEARLGVRHWGEP